MRHKKTIAVILAAWTIKLGRKPKVLEEALLVLLLQQTQALSAEDIFLKLYHNGVAVRYATMYNTLRRLHHMGLLQKDTLHGRKALFSTNL